MHISDFRYQIPNGTTAENIFPISVSRFQIPDHIFQISDPRSQGFVGGEENSPKPRFSNGKGRPDFCDGCESAARFRIICRQGDYKTRRSHPTEPVGLENRNPRCSLISGDYKTTAKDIPRARSRFLRSRKRDKQIQMPAKSAEVPRCQASSRFLGLRIWRSPHPCIVLSFGRILSTAPPCTQIGCRCAFSHRVQYMPPFLSLLKCCTFNTDCVRLGNAT